MGVDTDNIVVLGGDSTASNTGAAGGGAFGVMEVWLGHRCFWVVCQYHLLELPMRRVMIHYVGKTTSGNTFSRDSPIGKLIDSAHKLEINPDFEVIVFEYEFPEVPKEILDACLLYTSPSPRDS